MSEPNASDDKIPPGISKQEWEATPHAVRRLVLAQQTDLKSANRIERSGPNLDFFPDRKSRFLFAARVVVLVLMIGAVITYAFWDTAQPYVVDALTLSGLKERPKPTPIPTRLTILFPTPVPAAKPPRTPEPTAPSVSGASPAAPTKPPATSELTKEPPQSILIVSEDGLAVLELAPGTSVTGAGGEPVNSISTAAESHGLQWDIGIVGLSYAFGPAAAALDPPSQLTITYDPKAYYPFAYENIDCSKMHIAYFDEDKGAITGPWLDVEVDREANTVMTIIDHLGTYVLFCEVTGAPISFDPVRGISKCPI